MGGWTPVAPVAVGVSISIGSCPGETDIGGVVVTIGCGGDVDGVGDDVDADICEGNARKCGAPAANTFKSGGDGGLGAAGPTSQLLRANSLSLCSGSLSSVRSIIPSGHEGGSGRLREG